jgi:tetratricopeptide (TPR) repeat protein
VPDEPREAAEQLLREAHLLRMRKQYAEAESRCRRALELVPDDLAALDMLAELEYGKGNLPEARDLCQRILDEEPGRSVTETRLARITLELAERDQDRLLAETALAGGLHRQSGAERKRRVTISLMLSLLFAGAGQLYNGEYI